MIFADTYTVEKKAVAEDLNPARNLQNEIANADHAHEIVDPDPKIEIVEGEIIVPDGTEL